ncbi:HAD hydrolase-like protein [Maribellus mangrovi]|uniref:HAD hydrolase-like protein n=1 Tax=Maribellus mangrovi TaxID=3133146 RepID=UPI0030EE1942
MANLQDICRLFSEVMRFIYLRTYTIMAHFTHIIFDLDGTLTDNTQGIINSLKYSLEKMHIDDYPENLLDGFIGPPLQWGFSQLFGLNERDTKLAVEYFREYYSESGWHQNVPYDGVLEMIAELDHLGKRMYIATSKLEKYALKIMQHFEMDRYIAQLKGADYNGKKATKPQIISSLITSQQLTSTKEIVMIGDTLFDIEGGKENGLSTIAVGYGFGKEEELKNADPDYFVEDVEELFDILSA